MTTLVVCIDRGGEVTRGVDTPVVGWEAVESLVTRFGVDDPEDSRVNCLLEALHVTRTLREEGDDPLVAVLSGAGDPVSVDRAIARQTDGLLAEYDLESAIVVVDSPEDERLVPIVESRLTVDAVDRVVVRQARDIESTYYLLKQFLGDEQLRKTVLVPVGAGLLVFPLLLFVLQSVTVAVGAIAAVVGLFLLYKGLGVDAYVERVPGQVRKAMYSGQVALVTYVVAGGLGLIGVFAGAIGVSATATDSQLILAMRFAFDAVPWLTAAALAAATGRLVDELIRRDGVRSAYLNLPFGAVAVGLVVRGVSAYFLLRSETFQWTRIPAFEVGPIAIERITLTPRTQLALYLVGGIVVSLFGVRFAAYVSETDVEEELFDEN